MKISPSVRNILFEQVTREFKALVPADRFYPMMLYLESYDKVLRAFPWGMYSNPDNFKTLGKSEEGVIFHSWMIAATSKITKDFNKSRKLKRLLDSLIVTYDKNLAYNLSSEAALACAFSGYFATGGVPIEEEVAPIKPYEGLEADLFILRAYITCLLVIDYIEDEEAFECLLRIVIEGTDTIGRIVRLGSSIFEV